MKDRKYIKAFEDKTSELNIWKLKNNDEYGVLASSKKQAIMKFKRNLGMDVKGYMLIRVW